MESPRNRLVSWNWCTRRYGKLFRRFSGSKMALVGAVISTAPDDKVIVALAVTVEAARTRSIRRLKRHSEEGIEKPTDGDCYSHHDPTRHTQFPGD